MVPPIYGLRLAAARIQGFKSLRDLVVTFAVGTTVLVGENNSGKTSLLEALDVAFGKRRARMEDLYDGPGGKAPAFVIDLRVETTAGGDFPQSVVDLVGDAIQIADPDLVGDAIQPVEPDFFTLRVTGTADAEGWDVSLSRKFIKGWADDSAGAAALATLESPRVGRDVLALLHFDMLDARRDIVEQLRNRRTTWGRTLSKVSIADEVREELEDSLKNLGQQVTTKSPVLSRVREDLAALSEGLSAGNLSVELEALPRNVDDLIRAMDIVITSPESSAFSIESHGMGTRSLAALLVFRSYVNVVRPRLHSERLLSLAAFEEPEAHLHPQSQRAVFEILAAIGGQRIVSTHSTHVASIAELDAYRLFRRVGSETRVSSVPSSAVANWSKEHVRRFIQLENPEVLFAKAVGIVEGKTEADAFPVFARSWWGERGADGKGVSLIYTAGAQSALHIVPFLHALGIPWVIFSDGDQAGTDGLKAAGSALGRTLGETSPEVVLLPNGQAFESYLLEAGYMEQLCAAIDRHPKGPLDRFIRGRQGKKSDDKGGTYDYEGEGGRRAACLAFLERNKGTSGPYLAESIVESMGNPPVRDRLPPAVKEFFVRLDRVRS